MTQKPDNQPASIKVCENHPERETPLIFTMIFRGFEYWCPHCGYKGGFLGAGKNVPWTRELQNRLERDTKNAHILREANHDD